MPTPATDGQREFFANLLNTKRFPDGANKDHLKATFDGLDSKNASAWIEKALTLPDAEDAPAIPAPF